MIANFNVNAVKWVNPKKQFRNICKKIMAQYSSQVLNIVGLTIEEKKLEIKMKGGKKWNKWNYSLKVMDQKKYSYWSGKAKEHFDDIPSRYLNHIKNKFKLKKRKINNTKDDIISKQMAMALCISGDNIGTKSNLNKNVINKNITNKNSMFVNQQTITINKPTEMNPIFENMRNNKYTKNLYEKAINSSNKKKKVKEEEKKNQKIMMMMMMIMMMMINHLNL